jgi:adenylate cyclase, class 2
MAYRNLELKARCADLERAARAALELGARLEWTKRQTDTYFHVPRGRLKLREADGASAELIAYERLDHPEVRESAYHLVPVPDAGRLKAALTACLGVRVTVAKQRTLYLWHNVRVHLDNVENLGTFLEFEAVLRTPDDEAASPTRLAQIAEALGIRDEDRISQSYSDLLDPAG